MRHAIVSAEGAVVNVVEVEADSDWSPPDGHGAVKSDSANIGDRWDGKAFAPPAAPAPTRDELLAYAAALRWQKETGGIALANGARVATDPVAQSKVAAARDAFANGTLTGTIRFKALTGFFDADAADIGVVYAAIVKHVQAGYALESDVADAIAKGTITTRDEIDARFS